MNKPSETKKSSNKEKKIEAIKVHDFKVLRASILVKSGYITFDLELNGVIIYGCFVGEGKNGDFISFPSRKGNDGKYYSIVWTKLSDDDTSNILEEVERLINE